MKTPNPCLDGIVAATPAVARRSARANLPLVLQAAEEANLTASQAAYVLASAYHESQLGRLMTEIWGPTHAQSKYEGSARLGNTLAGDGKGYLGRGFVQITGRKHYQEWSDLLGYDLVGDPSHFRPIRGSLFGDKDMNPRRIPENASETLQHAIRAAYQSTAGVSPIPFLSF